MENEHGQYQVAVGIAIGMKNVAETNHRQCLVSGNAIASIEIPVSRRS